MAGTRAVVWLMGRPAPRSWRVWFVACAVWLRATASAAWIFPEHAEISERGAAELEPAQRAILEGFWNEARRGFEGKLCVGVKRAPVNAEGAVSCLGFADLPAAAGDHSCSPSELGYEATAKTWLRDVVQVGNETRRRMAEASNESERVNAWSRSNLLFERVDTGYGSRAGSNNAHFVPSSEPGESIEHYLRRAVDARAELNAVVLYVLYHANALRYAAAYAEVAATGGADEASIAKRTTYARRALLNEFFALHFLEDSFSSGHVVGVWGGAATVKGTHDEYSLHGYPGRTWSGESYSAYGDASMSAEDLRRASAAVKASLADVTRAVIDADFRAKVVSSWSLESANRATTFNSCKEKELGFQLPNDGLLQFAEPVWKQTLTPSPGEDYAHMPRFRAELGPFFSFGAATDFGAAWGGYFSESSAPRLAGDALLAIGMGIGLEGAIGISSDGLIELGVGGAFASKQYEPGCDDCGVGATDTVPARVPTRSGFLMHYRAPYWLIPGDLLVAAPFLLLADKELYKSMAIVSANGGVFGLQQVVLTPVGSLQFMLGRELFVTLYNDDDPLARFDGGDRNDSNDYTLFEVNSVEFDAPILTYIPLRTFSNTLTSQLGLQLGANMDIPRATNVATAEQVSPGNAYGVYLRVFLRSRWYVYSNSI